MALSGNVWLWVHWVSRYTWPTSVGWRAVNGAQVCPPAPPYSMKDNQTKSMGLLIKLWTTPRLNYLTHLTTSPDPLISFDILPNKFPFSDKLPTLVDSVLAGSDTRSMQAQRHRSGCMKLWSVSWSRKEWLSQESQSSSICGHLFFLQHLGPPKFTTSVRFVGGNSWVLLRFLNSNPGVELPRVTWGGARMGSSSCDSSNVSVPTGSMSSRRGDGGAP